MDRYYRKTINRHRAFVLAKRLFGGQKEFTRRTGIKRGKTRYMRDDAKNVNVIDALKIELKSNGALNWHLFVDNVDEEVKQRIDRGASNVDRAPQLVKKFSDRVREAMAYEKTFKHQGQRNDLALRLNSNEVTGRTAKNAAKLYGIESEWAYRQGKQVVLSGCDELINAMDTWLAVSVAAKLTRYSKAKQRWILTQRRQDILAYAKGEQYVDKKILEEIVENQQR